MAANRSSTRARKGTGSLRAVPRPTVDQALEQFLTAHLTVEKGRAEKTVNGYRSLHRRWFSPTIGSALVEQAISIQRARLEAVD